MPLEPEPASEEAEHASLWERLERPAPAPRVTLTHGQIAAAAVAIADVEGFGAVTIRNLAARLGVGPMGLYRYVTSKDDIVELMVDAVYADYPAPPETTSWRDVMHAHALHTRSALLAHRWLIAVPPRERLALTPHRFAVIDRALASLEHLAVEADERMSIFDTVTAYATGATTAEITQTELMESQGWRTGDDLRAALRPQMAWLMGTGRYPSYQRYLNTAARKDDAEWRFNSGLEWVLDGIGHNLTHVP